MRLEDALIRRVYARAKAERWALSFAAFASCLQASAQREFRNAEPDTRQLERYFASLHLEDLALACACAEGIEPAWETFVRDYRPTLYRAADALDRSGGAREIADSLYGELFGLRSRDRERHSHLRYFHGRSSLSTWLRAVLSQRLIDRRRHDARFASLPDEEEGPQSVVSAGGGAASSTLIRFMAILQRVIGAVVAALPARDRLRLRCYYAQDMTLGQIGKMLSESEATASRALARTRRAIRDEVERQLRDQERMSESEIAEYFAALVEDSGPLDLAEMLGNEPILVEGRKNVSPNRST